ncbi:hypothetical protein LZ554_000204 [Drepanopeziza brunnea f. sp. 'monogermtubi']|nr:hypothetical protein LZ554_000204 [Drepanopeziza brunnea f. sp. 'monogermtubi']
MSNGSVRSTASPEPRDAARESAPNSEVGVGDPTTSTQDDAGMDLEADLEAALDAELFGESDSEDEEKEGDGEEASKLKDSPHEQVHDEEQWGDCATADDYWRQFEHEPTPVDGVTPRELQDEDVVMDDDDSPARTRQDSEQPQEVDAKGPPFILKVEPPDTETPDWGDHATEQAYWQQFEHNDKADIPQLHVHGGEEAADASDREEWGDYQTSDEYWAQFDKPSRKVFKASTTGAAGRGGKRDKSFGRTWMDKSSGRPQMDRQAINAGRWAKGEGKNDRPLTPPPSRPIPSNARADEQRAREIRLPTLKSPDEASIWETADAIISSTSAMKDYTAWSKACTAFFADQTARVPFPSPRQFVTGACKRARGCVKGVRLGVCHHEIETLFRGSSLWSAKWLRKERSRWHPRWHPDRFSGDGEGHIEVQELAAEMFWLVQRLVDGFAKGETKGRWGI